MWPGDEPAVKHAVHDAVGGCWDRDKTPLQLEERMFLAALDVDSAGLSRLLAELEVPPARLRVWTNREATTLEEIPGQVLIVGGSAVAVELSQFLVRMGARTTLVERSDRLVTQEEPRVGPSRRWPSKPTGSTSGSAGRSAGPPRTGAVPGSSSTTAAPSMLPSAFEWSVVAPEVSIYIYTRS